MNRNPRTVIYGEKKAAKEVWSESGHMDRSVFCGGWRHKKAPMAHSPLGVLAGLSGVVAEVAEGAAGLDEGIQEGMNTAAFTFRVKFWDGSSSVG